MERGSQPCGVRGPALIANRVRNDLLLPTEDVHASGSMPAPSPVGPCGRGLPWGLSGTAPDDVIPGQEAGLAVRGREGLLDVPRTRRRETPVALGVAPGGRLSVPLANAIGDLSHHNKVT